MSIYAISDLHLAISIDKPMDIFGGRWMNYMEKLKENWMNTVGENDYVIIPGDISWATYLEQAIKDFRFIESLPGKKIISKGNHDYWWTTKSKLDEFLNMNLLKSISFMHNNSFIIENYILCGTRGWKCPGEDSFNAEDRKIYNRELQRLELSLKSIKERDKEIIVAMHYPPFNTKDDYSQMIQIMKDYNVGTCLFGHLHGESAKNVFSGVRNGIEFKIISADLLGFSPIKIK